MDDTDKGILLLIVVGFSAIGLVLLSESLGFVNEDGYFENPFSPQECVYNVYCDERQSGFDVGYSAVVALTKHCVIEKDGSPRVCVMDDSCFSYYEFPECVGDV